MSEISVAHWRALLLAAVLFLTGMANVESDACFLGVSQSYRAHKGSPVSVSLIPSQVRMQRYDIKRQSTPDDQIALIPSQINIIPGSHRTRTAKRSSMKQPLSPELETSSSVAQNARAPSLSSRRKSHTRKPRKTRSDASTRSSSPPGQRRKKHSAKRVLTGDLPDVRWRAVPMEHLRAHPNFDPLPPAETIKALESLEDVRNFRQDSWQWDALHDGRCTTSQAAAALGLLDPKAARVLNIPQSWRRGGLTAYHRLRGEALRTLEEMNDVVCQKHNQHDRPWNSVAVPHGPYWSIPESREDGTRFPFAAKYLPRITPEERRRRHQTAERNAHDGMHMSVRLSWGNSQEATALLCALNYFWKKEPEIRVKEVGMCGAGLRMNGTDSSLLIGASPDGLLVYPDGSVEALEVKNHCPFVPIQYGQNSTTSDRFAVRQMPFRDPTIPPLYVPQLMMEMLCVGEECRSAVMVRLTASNGASVLRLHRDDEWIDEMLFWMNRFQNEHVAKEIPPPQNFFWDDDETELRDRYRKFVERTKEIGENVEILDHCKHAEVQRVLATHRSITSLFLD